MADGGMGDLSSAGLIAYQAARAMPKLGHVDSVAKADKVAQDFEAVFLSQMLQPVFANIEAEEPFGGGVGNEIWRSMMVDEVGKQMARAGGIGIAPAIKQEILRIQEVKP